MVIMKNNIVKDSFVAISDFHGYEYPLEKVKDYYLNEYDKIFILGDVTDRGPDGQGAQGIEMLKEIKRLTEQYPERVVYIPGNHDTFVYDYGKYQDQNVRYFLERYHGKKTVEEIERLREANPKELNDLMNWLGKQPIQVMHNYNGKQFALAHAFFNQTIYELEPDLTLEDVYRVHRNEQGSRLDRAYQAILWYRKGQESSYGNIETRDVPTDAIMVIGHTPERSRATSDLSLTNRYGEKTPVFCVDGGIASGDKMLKYDGKDHCDYTPFYCHHDTSPKPNNGILDYEHNMETFNKLMDNVSATDYHALAKAMAESVRKHKIAQQKGILELAWIGRANWYIYTSGNTRESMKDLGTEPVKRMLASVGVPGDSLEDKINRLLGVMYWTSEEFKNAIDERTAMIGETPAQYITEGLNDKYIEELKKTAATASGPEHTPSMPMDSTSFGYGPEHTPSWEEDTTAFDNNPDDEPNMKIDPNNMYECDPIDDDAIVTIPSFESEPFTIRSGAWDAQFRASRNHQQEVPKILIKRAPQPYGMTRENIIQDDLNA